MGGTEGLSASIRERVFDAVLEEVTSFGIDKFSPDRVVRRAGVDPNAIRNEWRDSRLLLMEALVSRSDQTNPCPDTGRLGDDLRELGAALVRLNESETARQLTRRMLPGGRDADFGEVGPDLLSVRFDSLKPIFRRAAERGELRSGVDPDDAIRMFIAATLHGPIFRDAPVRPDYAEQVRDAFLHGILAPQLQAPSLTADVERRDQMQRTLRAVFDGMIDPGALLEAVRDVDGHVIDFTVLEVNPAATTDLSRSREELIGSSLLDVWPDLAACLVSTGSGQQMTAESVTIVSPRLGESRHYDLRAGRADTDWLSITWRDVS